MRMVVSEGNLEKMITSWTTTLHALKSGECFITNHLVSIATEFYGGIVNPEVDTRVLQKLVCHYHDMIEGEALDTLWFELGTKMSSDLSHRIRL